MLDSCNCWNENSFSVYIIKDACKKTERSGHAYEINNEIFLAWANEIVILFQPQAENREGGKDVISALIKKEKREKLEEKVKRGEEKERIEKPKRE